MDHLLAIRYATTAEAVRGWPADDYLTAIALYQYTGGRSNAE